MHADVAIVSSYEHLVLRYLENIVSCSHPTTSGSYKQILGQVTILFSWGLQDCGLGRGGKKRKKTILILSPAG